MRRHTIGRGCFVKMGWRCLPSCTGRWRVPRLAQFGGRPGKRFVSRAAPRGFSRRPCRAAARGRRAIRRARARRRRWSRRRYDDARLGFVENAATAAIAIRPPRSTVAPSCFLAARCSTPRAPRRGRLRCNRARSSRGRDWISARTASCTRDLSREVERAARGPPFGRARTFRKCEAPSLVAEYRRARMITSPAALKCERGDVLLVLDQADHADRRRRVDRAGGALVVER